MCAAPVEDTTGLPRGVSCVQHQSNIPRACPVESHVCSTSRRYHGLAPWSLMCAAPVEDTTGLPRGVSCVQHQSKIPRACPVESHVCSYQNFKTKGVQMPRARPVERHVFCYLATNAKLHGTSPWHPDSGLDHRCSDERNTPRDKPVASRQWVRSSV